MITSENYPEIREGVRQLVAAFPGEWRLQAVGVTEQDASAAAMFDMGEPCGTRASMADMLASGASCYAADDQCIQTHGSIDFAEKYDVERQFRETRLYQAAPISINLIPSHFATHALGLPKNF